MGLHTDRGSARYLTGTEIKPGLYTVGRYRADWAAISNRSLYGLNERGIVMGALVG